MFLWALIPALSICYLVPSISEPAPSSPILYFPWLLSSTGCGGKIFIGQECSFRPRCLHPVFYCYLNHGPPTYLQLREWRPVCFPHAPDPVDFVVGLIKLKLLILSVAILGIHVRDSISTDSMVLEDRFRCIREGKQMPPMSFRMFMHGWPWRNVFL